MTEIMITTTKDEFISRAEAIFIQSAQQACSTRQRFSVALSGGSTPLPIYQSLAHNPAADELDWSKIHFFWGDERTVPPHHPDCNFGQASLALLEPREIPAVNIHRIEGELPPETAAKKYQTALLSFFEDNPPRLDLILLGMGEDGHTASLFPGTRALSSPEEIQELVIALNVPKLDTWRISFSPRLILAARQIVFLVSGKDKAATLAQVLEGPFQPEKYPSQLFRDQATWLVDQSAAGELQQLD